MPIYEYRCKKCNFKFEEFQSVGASSDSITCPECGEPKPERIFSVFGSGAGSGSENTISSGGCNSSSPFS